jgi:hypothetical protein
VRCRWRLPNHAVPTAAVDGWVNSAHALLLTALAIAGHSPVLCRQIQATATRLIAERRIDPDDAFGYALGMPQT